MFERFTDQSIKTIMYAQYESRRLNHCSVGTEQFLVGLIRVGPGIASRALIESGVSLSAVRAEVERVVGRGDGDSLEMPFDNECKCVFDRCWEEARRYKNNYIGTQHLLLGLVRDGDEISTAPAVGLLELLGVDIPSLIAKVEEKMVSEKISYPVVGSPVIPGVGRQKATQLPLSKRNHYQILQIARSAELGLIEKVHSYLSKKYHPDQANTGDQVVYEMIEKAWEVLGDEVKRREYDEALARSDSETS